MTRLSSAVLLLLLVMVASGRTAHANLIENGGFELGQVPNPCFIFDIGVGSTLITGWTVSQGTIDWDGPPPCSVTPGAGAHSLDLVGQIGIGGIQQTFATTPGKCYKISFDLAGNPGAPPTIKPIAVNINGVNVFNDTFSIAGKSASNMGWVRKSVKFVATSPSTTVEFVSDVRPSGGTLNAGANLDNVGARHSHGCP